MPKCTSLYDSDFTALALGALLFLVTTAAPSQDTTWYVAPSGDDTQDGSIARPWQTITHARDVLRGQIPSMAGNLIVVLRGGLYPLSSTIVLDARDAGANGHDVIYQAADGERPLISGGIAINGWTLHDPTLNIWQAAVPAWLNTRQLYVNGIRAARAASSTPLGGNPVQDTTGYLTTDPTLASWRHPEDLEFVYTGAAAHAMDTRWTEDRIGVTSVTTGSTGTRITMQQPCYSQALSKGEQEPHFPTSIENAYELLQQPGQWYLDRHASILYYIPKPTEDLMSVAVEAPVLETLLEGDGTADAPLQHIRFLGLTFAYATWLLPETAGVVPNFAEWCIGYDRIPANVVLHGAAFVSFERDVFTHLGSAGLCLDRGSHDCSVTGCVLRDISAGGIELGEREAAPADSRMQTVRHSIVDNYIADIGEEYRGTVGISTGYVANTLVAHNEIARTPYTGICLGLGTGGSSYAGSNHVSNNNIHDIMSTLDDGGGIYTFMMPMPLSTFDNNYIHDFDSKMFGAGIYPDEGSANIEISNNVFSNVPRWLRVWIASTHDLTVHDNFTSSATMINVGTNVTVTATTVVPGSWPSAGQSIISTAGIESSFQDILQLPLDPSVTGVPSANGTGSTTNGSTPTGSSTATPISAQHLQAAPGSGHGCGLGSGIGIVLLSILHVRHRRGRRITSTCPGSAAGG